MDKDTIRTSFDRHRANPNVSTEEYVREYRIKLGESVMTRERVYLDLRYWIILRDVVLGRTTDKSSVAVLTGLRNRVQTKRSICPISESVFLELLKQADIDTRRATAKLIDELSEGVTLLPYPERVATEIAHFLHSMGASELHPLHNLVWSKLSYVLGVQHPTNSYFTESEQRVIQKAFFDLMWLYSLAEMVDLLGNEVPPTIDLDVLADRLNEGSAQHADAMKSFSHVYKSEIRGSLSLFMTVACEVLESIATRASGSTIQVSELEKIEYEKQLLGKH